MNYIVGRVPEGIRIDPDAGRQERQRKRERTARRGGSGDSVVISDEARTRSLSEGEGKEPE